MLWHCWSNSENWMKNPVDAQLYMPNLIILLVFVLLNWFWFKALLVKFLYLPPDGKKIDYENDDQLNPTALSNSGRGTSAEEPNAKKAN